MCVVDTFRRQYWARMRIAELDFNSLVGVFTILKKTLNLFRYNLITAITRALRTNVLL